MFNSFRSAFGKTTSNESLRQSGRLLLLALTILLNTIHLNAQPYDTLDASTVHFEIIAPNVTLNQGETATINIEVGTASAPVNYAVEFDVELELGDDATFTSNPGYDLSSSWFYPLGNLDTTQSSNATARTVSLQGIRSSNVSGHGILFQVTLEADRDGVEASDLVSGGGIHVLVEDLGFKRHATALETTMPLKAYPNPASDLLNLELPKDSPATIALLNQQGQPVLRRDATSNQVQALSVGHLPRGIYILISEQAGQRQTQKIILK